MAQAIGSASQRASGFGSGGLPRNGGSSKGSGSSNRPRMTWKSNLKALVVDNERFSQHVEKGILRNFGVETEAVETGEAAVELIASGATFNLIFIDISLPAMDGPRTAMQIRAMGVQSKIIGLSSSLTEEDEEEFLRAGVDKCIEKPLTTAWLVPVLRELDGQI